MVLPERRTLWQKVLTAHKNVAAATSVVESGKVALESVKALMDLGSDVPDSHLPEVVKQMESLRGISKTLDQLKAARGSDAASEIQKQLETELGTLQTWVREVLCPRTVPILQEIATYLDNAVPLKADASNQEMAEAYTGTVPKLPEAVTSKFKLRCFLASQVSDILLFCVKFENELTECVCMYLTVTCLFTLLSESRVQTNVNKSRH